MKENRKAKIFEAIKKDQKCSINGINVKLKNTLPKNMSASVSIKVYNPLILYIRTFPFGSGNPLNSFPGKSFVAANM